MRAKKRYGQHFLEAAWVDRLVRAIDPAESDQILEIGPGRGALTLALAPRVAALLAVEIDRELVLELGGRLPSHVRVVQGDFLDLDLPSVVAAHLLPPVRVAANLPYNVASPVIVRLVRSSQDGSLVRDATLMVQLEVADRLTAGPGSGDYGPLGILVQRHADVSRLLTLPPGAFRPVPKVSSAVVRLSFRAPVVAVSSPTAFDALVRGIFAYRRKTLARALATWQPGLDVSALVARSGLDGRRRPETLELQELARLADVFASAKQAAVL